MAYTKNPYRYPQPFWDAINGTTQTLTYPTPREAKSARHKLSNFRRALREAVSHPALAQTRDDWLHLYQNALATTTRLSPDQLTLTIIAPRTLDGLVTPPQNPIPPQNPSVVEDVPPASTPAESPAPIPDFRQTELNDICEEFARTIRSHFFSRIFKALPLDLPQSPPEIMEIAYSIAPDYEPNDALKALLEDYNALSAPRN